MSIAGAPAASALELSTYAENSRLAQGRWAKISVPASGLYIITSSDLRKMGFSDPSKVRIFGYGGQRIPDQLSQANYIDDLPAVQTETTSKGILFYALGPETWRQSVNGRYAALDNIYSTKGYYFLCESSSAEDNREIPAGGFPKASEPMTTFNERVRHEQNLTSASENGWLMVGEDFRFTPSRTFNFTLADRVENTPVWMQTSVVANCPKGSNATLTYTVNGNPIPQVSGDNIKDVTEKGMDGREGLAKRTFDLSGERLALGVTLKASGTIRSANLNYIVLNYTRALRLPSTGYLDFTLPHTSASLSVQASAKDVRVWDVTSPLNIRKMDTASADNSLIWTNDITGVRSYVAWTPEATIPSPDFEGYVENQNLHSIGSADMVIVTPRELIGQAQRIADFHRSSSDSLKVEVVVDTYIYNEFSSGCADVSGIRKFFKMLYDRGAAAGEPLRYGLLFGSPTYDNRHITEYFRRNATLTLPSYYGGEAASQMNENDGYGTDDFVALLEDNSGTSLSSDILSIAVGRIPARSAIEARNTVDKIMRYYADTKRTSWKQQMVVLADDGNSGVHMVQADSLANALEGSPNNPININKIYIDAYELVGGVYEGARNEMYRLLDEGAVWWAYIGHANTTSWTSEGLLTFNDINSLFLKHPPMLYAATCEFLRWDSNVTSGCELLFHERNGGIIGAISATRPVYIALNEYMSTALGKNLAQRDSDGRMLTVGEIYRRTKNLVGQATTSGTNHRRYVLMADPAMRLAVPNNMAVLDNINGASVDDPENPVVIGARQECTFSGRIIDPAGNLIEDFDGVIIATVNDAERSITTHGNNSDGDTGRHTFDKQGERLFTGAGKVEKGRFEVKVSMPSEIADNYRPAQFLMYAYTSDTQSTREAAGTNKGFYVFGFDESAPDDSTPPTIESCVLNHSTFTDGDVVNPSPMVLARVSDNIAINLSSAGIGHSMSITIDGNRMFTDVSQYFSPDTDGSPAGSIAYPLDNLTPGSHTLTLRVWDTSGNSASTSVNFTVAEGIAPEIFEVYSDANPASTTANFFISHNRPDEQLQVSVAVYNLMGRELWSDSMTARSDMFLSTPLTWNLCDYANRRVDRGIYIYRAQITTPDGGHTTASKRIAVTAP